MGSRRDSLRRAKRRSRMMKDYDLPHQVYFSDNKKDGIGAGVILTAVIIFILFVVLTVALALRFLSGGGEVVSNTEPDEYSVTTTKTDPPAITLPPVAYEPEADPTMQIATFLQGPKSWKKKYDWSGEWGDADYDGGRFGGFGCGLCCMANLYTSLTPYKSSPIDIYRFAKKNSAYKGGAAIDWPHMKDSLKKMGFSVQTGRKPKAYKQFKKIVSSSLGMIVVVSKGYGNNYWKKTSGHYVTVLSYDVKKDKIFIGDSGDVAHNRHWIALKTLYGSIKMTNPIHYMSITKYDKSKDEWRHKKITGKWVKPEGFIV